MKESDAYFSNETVLRKKEFRKLCFNYDSVDLEFLDRILCFELNNDYTHSSRILSRRVIISGREKDGRVLF